MRVELLHLVTGGTQVLAGVELTGLLVEDLANGCGHGQTGVGVDVDLADSALGSLAELLLGDTYSVGQFATVGVDDVNVLLRNGAGAVENDGEAGKLLLNLVEHVEGQRRGNQTTGLGVTGALLGLELGSGLNL